MQYLIPEEMSESEEDYKEVQVLHLKIRLPPPQSLWAHVLWNSSRFLAEKIKNGVIQVQNKTVYEMGVGAGIPSIISTQNGAKRVLMQEIPRDILLDNIKFNLANNLTEEQLKHVEVTGHYWADKGKVPNEQFDIIIQCDLVSNHTEHENLISETKQCLKQDGIVHVLFGHHRPQYIEKDLRFFKHCQNVGFIVEKRQEIKIGRMFPEDDEIYEIEPREWLHWYTLRLM